MPEYVKYNQIIICVMSIQVYLTEILIFITQYVKYNRIIIRLYSYLFNKVEYYLSVHRLIDPNHHKLS